MTRVLLDTSALSALFRGHEAIAQSIALADRVCVSPVSLGELRSGFHGGTRFEENQGRLERFLDKPLVRTVKIDAETADRYAQIHDSLRHAGRPIPSNNIWIAATAMQFGLRVVTTDGHFEHVPQIAVDHHAV